VFDLDLWRARLETTPTLPPSIVDISGRLSDGTMRELSDRLGPGLTANTTGVNVEMRLKAS
jgi:hypothetical protein